MSSSVTVVNAIQADEINRDSVRLSLPERKSINTQRRITKHQRTRCTATSFKVRITN